MVFVCLLYGRLCVWQVCGHCAVSLVFAVLSYVPSWRETSGLLCPILTIQINHRSPLSFPLSLSSHISIFISLPLSSPLITWLRVLFLVQSCSFGFQGQNSFANMFSLSLTEPNPGSHCSIYLHGRGERTACSFTERDEKVQIWSTAGTKQTCRGIWIGLDRRKSPPGHFLSGKSQH